MIIRMGFDRIDAAGDVHQNDIGLEGQRPDFFNYLQANAGRLGLQVMATRSEELASGTGSWLYEIPVKSDQPELLFTPGNGFWEHLPAHVRESVIAKRCAIVLNNLMEGDAGPGLFDTHMNPYLKTVPVTSRQVGYVCSALNAAVLNRECSELALTKVQMQVASCSHWESNVSVSLEQDASRVFHLPDTEQVSLRAYTEMVKEIAERSKRYLCFNGRLREHRVALVSLLAEYGLLDSGFVSLPESVDDITSQDVLLAGFETRRDELMAGYLMHRDTKRGLARLGANFPLYLEQCRQFWSDRLVKRGFCKLRATLPLHVDDYRQPSGHVAAALSTESRSAPLSTSLYLDSYFSVVTETFYRNRCIFPTEKVFKPILHLHPFIAVAPQGYLQGLRDLGYRTFEPIINESYDQIANNTSRLKAIMSEIRRLCALPATDMQVMFASLHDTLEHNVNHLVDLKNREMNSVDHELVTFVSILTSGIGRG